MSSKSKPSPAPTTTPRPNHQKAMSSRLLTMKFMQRAAASSPTTPSSPGTPEAASSSNKRQRTDDSPQSFNVNELADQKAIREAIEKEEKRVQAAVDKAAEDAGDTRWVLNFEEKAKQPPAGTMRVQQMSYANIDRAPAVIRSLDEEEGDKPIGGGRRSFGKFNRKLEKLQDPDAQSSSDEDDSDEEEDDGRGDYEDDSEDGDDPTNQLIRGEREAAARRMKEERRAKRKAEKKELARLAASRKKNEVNLNSLSSISGGGQAGGSVGPCFGCGKEGHRASECPLKGKRKSIGGGSDHYAGQRDQNRNKKARKSY